MKKTTHTVAPVGTHIIIDLYGCPPSLLNQPEKVKDILLEAAKISNSTILHTKFHTFPTNGVSGIILISESHLSIHTWPECNYASIDIYTCGTKTFPQKAADFIIEKFKSKKPTIMKIERGVYAEKFKTSGG